METAPGYPALSTSAMWVQFKLVHFCHVASWLWDWDSQPYETHLVDVVREIVAIAGDVQKTVVDDALGTQAANDPRH